MAKKEPVPVQKGPIVADQRTMKHDTRQNITKEDSRQRQERFDGQTMRKVNSPKQ